MQIEQAIKALREQAYLAGGHFTQSERECAKAILGHIAVLEDALNEKCADNATEEF